MSNDEKRSWLRERIGYSIGLPTTWVLLAGWMFGHWLPVIIFGLFGSVFVAVLFPAIIPRLERQEARQAALDWARRSEE